MSASASSSPARPPPSVLGAVVVGGGAAGAGIAVALRDFGVKSFVVPERYGARKGQGGRFI